VGGSYMRALALCEDAVLMDATRRGLVSPPLPVLPAQLASRDFAAGMDAYERQGLRDDDTGAASQTSVLSLVSQSTEEYSGHQPAAPAAASEASAVELPDLLGLVFGPYIFPECSNVGAATHVTPADLEALLPHLRTRRLLRGEALWRRGDDATSMFVVHAGKLQISLPKGPSCPPPDTSLPPPDTSLLPPAAQSPSLGPRQPASPLPQGSAGAAPHEPLVLEVLLPGAILGYLHGLSVPPRPRFADAIVTSKWAVVHELPLDLLSGLLSSHPHLTMGIMQCALDRCSHEYNNIMQVRVRAHVCECLLNMCGVAC
jgi:CRP-like cAMP-binding protein